MTKRRNGEPAEYTHLGRRGRMGWREEKGNWILGC